MVLVLVMTMLVKPLWPIGEYIVNFDYIVNVLCENKDRPDMNCDGKCYLSKQLAKESEKNQKNPFGEKRANSEIQHVVFFQVLPQIDLSHDSTDTNPANFNTSNTLTTTLLTSDLGQPPELV